MSKRTRIFLDPQAVMPVIDASHFDLPAPCVRLPAHAWGDPGELKTPALEALAAERGIEVTTIVCGEASDEDYLGVPNVDFNINKEEGD